MKDWLFSHTPSLFLIGILFIVGSFLTFGFRKPRLPLLCLGVFLLILASLFALKIISSPPSLEVTVDQDNRPKSPPVPSIRGSRLESLRTAWDSEGYSDWPVAEVLAEISNNAYEAPVDAEPSYRAMGFEQAKVFLHDSMVGYVVAWKDVVVVAFRGTDDEFDWFANLDDAPAQTPNGQIHRGFYTAYKSLKPQIVQLLSQREHKHLWITGHSLGGALAVVCAYDLIQNDKKSVDGLITFGQPMVVRKQLADYIDTEASLLGRFAHYVNDNDIVPKVPPSFVHCGSLVWFTPSGIKRSRPKGTHWAGKEKGTPEIGVGSEIKPLSDEDFERVKAEVRAQKARPKWSSDGSPLHYGQLQMFRDHAMTEYLAKIRSMRKAQEPR